MISDSSRDLVDTTDQPNVGYKVLEVWQVEACLTYTGFSILHWVYWEKTSIKCSQGRVSKNSLLGILA